MKNNKLIFGCMLMFFLAVVSVSSVSAANITVDNTNYTSVISTANDGDTIEFNPGNYSHTGSLTISKSLNLVAKGQVRMTTNNPEANIITINAPRVNISGFYFYGAISSAAIYATGNANGINIKNNTIENNWNGINIESSVNNVNIENNKINNNRNYGIRMNSGGYEIHIRNNELISNAGRAIGLTSISNSSIINNTCYNQLDAGVQVDNGNNILIQGNKVNNTTRNSGIVTLGGNYIRIVGNNISNTSGSAAGQSTQSCFGINTQNVNNLIIQNNIIRNSSSIGTGWRGGILVYNTVTSYNTTISNNELLDMNLIANTLAYGIYSNSVNTTFDNNTVSNIYNGIYSTSVGLNSSFLNNKVNNTYYGLRVTSANTRINNNAVFNSYYGFYCSGVNSTLTNNLFDSNTNSIWHATNYGNLINNTVINSISEGVVITGNYNTLVNNTIIYNNKGIRLAGNNNTLMGSNIYNNTLLGLNLTGNNNNVNYNRIFSNGVEVALTGSRPNNVDYNWWGTNNITAITSVIPVNSYFVANATAIKNTGVVGESWLVNYTFYLNGTNDNSGSEYLPNFIAYLINNSNNTIYSQSATNSSVLPIKIYNVSSGNYFVIVDNEKIPLGTLSSEKANTTVDMNVSGEIDANKTVIVNGKLKDILGNNLANKTVYFTVNGNVIAVGQTNEFGEISFNYTFSGIGKYDFALRFDGDENYINSSNSQEYTIEKKQVKTEIHFYDIGEVKIGKTVKLRALLTDDEGNPLAGKAVDFYVNGVKVGTAITNGQGIATLDYTPNKAGEFRVDVKFGSDSDYLSSESYGYFKVISKNNPNPGPNPDPKPNPKPQPDNNANAGMKKTGVPVFFVLLMLLSSLGLIIKRK